MFSFYWLLARCQQALWNLDEVTMAYHAKDWDTLRAKDIEEFKSDLKFVVFVVLTGYGPLLREA